MALIQLKNSLTSVSQTWKSFHLSAPGGSLGLSFSFLSLALEPLLGNLKVWLRKRWRFQTGRSGLESGCGQCESQKITFRMKCDPEKVESMKMDDQQKGILKFS